MRRVIGVTTALMMSQAAATAEPQQIDLDVPSTTVATTVQINVKPSKGAVLLYTGPSPSYSRQLGNCATDVAESRHSIHDSGCNTDSRTD